MKTFPAMLLGAALFIASSCGAQSEYQTTEGGLEYRYITKGTDTAAANIGEIAFINLTFRIGDSVLINTMKVNKNEPVPQMLAQPAGDGDLMEGLLLMHKGDSMEFRILMDTLAVRAGRPMPEWTKPGDYAVWNIKMVDIKTQEQLQQEKLENAKVQLQKDDSILQAYFNEHQIENVQKTESGLYYVIHQEGTGPHPQVGDKVTVNYTGTDLEGNKFDSNVDSAFHHVQPFVFPLGAHQVIPGWDEGVALMRKGGKATFYIPSPLAYGERGSGPKIPPNAILIFDIELIDF